MKTFGANLQDHIDSGATSLVACWALYLTDGAELFFTEADVDIDVDGDTYLSRPAFARTAITVGLGLGSDNLQVDGYMQDDAIEEEDLLAGRYDKALVEVFLVNRDAPEDGRVPLVLGYLGEVTTNRNGFSATLDGITALLNQVEGEVTTPECPYILGDSRCTVSLAPFTSSGTVTAVASRRTFTTGVTSAAAGYFDYGLLTWTSGANDGRAMEVKTYGGGTGAFTLQLPMFSQIQIGDTFSVHAGCDKRLSTCRDKFNNVINFGGEPHIPGQDRMLNPR